MRYRRSNRKRRSRYRSRSSKRYHEKRAARKRYRPIGYRL